MTELLYIDLERRFREIVDLKTGDPEPKDDNEYEWDWMGRHIGQGWEDLESRYRTVILAEAGSGKTREMLERCNKLKKEGKFALFLPLERLDDESLEDLLGPEDWRDFNAWRHETSDPGWIFLDALDELKLRDGYFEVALRRLRKQIQGAEMRAKLIVSCRPSDWQYIDLGAFSKIFPAPVVSHEKSEKIENVASPTGLSAQEERFLAPLKVAGGIYAAGGSGNCAVHSRAGGEAEQLAVYRLLPLGREHAETLIRSANPPDVEALLQEIRQTDAWDFTRHPQDIIELLAIWEREGRLGTRTEQYEAHITMRLRERSDRPGEAQQLSDAEARIGAERLALALFLSRTRTLVYSGGTGPAKGAGSGLEVDSLLSDWKPDHRKALLRLGVFDPSTFGRVRFHRRGVEEYLAASRLSKLSDAGIASRKALERILFISKPGSDGLILPESMQPLAVWLAQWKPDILRVVNQLLPGLLISEGDSESFSPECRISILKSVIECSLRHTHRTPSCTPAELRRFATPELSQAIKDNWARAASEKSSDLLDFFLALIRDGALEGFDKLLEAVARSDQHRPIQRALALQALVKSNSTKATKSVVKDIVASSGDWPHRMIAHTLDELYPTFINTDQLINVISKVAQKAANTADRLQQALGTIASRIDPTSKEAERLRKELTNLIIKNQVQGSAHYHAVSHFSWVAAPLATLCLKQCLVTPANKRKSLLLSCIAANLFRDHHHLDKDDITSIREWISEGRIPKDQLFVYELQFIISAFVIVRDEGPLVMQNSFIRGLTSNDEDWLKQVASKQSLDTRVRLTALLELVHIWNGLNRPPKLKREIRKIAEEEKELEKWTKRWFAPRKPYPGEKEHAKIMRIRNEKEKARLDSWIEWRKQLISNPNKFFKGKELPRTRRLLFDWLLSDNNSGSTYQIWNQGAGVQAAFGAKIRDRARTAYASYWRSVECIPFSKRANKDHGIPYSWLFGLIGLLAESEKPGWTSALSKDEVRRACLLALVEINGLPAFMETLAKDQEEYVSAALSDELKAQLRLHKKHHYLPLLQDLTHASPPLQKTCLSVLLNFVAKWTNSSDDESSKNACYHLGQALEILITNASLINVKRLTKICELQFIKSPTSSGAIHWLRALFSINGLVATRVTENAIKTIPQSCRKETVVTLFGSIFDPYRGTSIKIDYQKCGADTLARLCRLAYRYIIPAEDRHRESGVAYSPDTRDHAEHARSMLMNQLIEASDSSSRSTISKLAAEPEFETAKDYILNGLRVKENRSAEPSPMSVKCIHALEESFERPPYDRDSMFYVMMNRLQDLQEDISTHDYFPRHTAQSIKAEDEMQRLLAFLLERSSNSVYSLVREDEVADAKRTDIRLLSRVSRSRSVIEVKMAESNSKWSVNDYLTALEVQLVGQYLRHADCKAGCLLITTNGTKVRWQNPETKKSMCFLELIAYLNRRACVLQKKHGDIQLCVFGLDFSNPHLPNPH